MTSTEPRKTGRTGTRRPVGSTKRMVREAALALFAEQGYRSTTLRQIGERIGILSGSVYNHIASKEDLLFEILQDVHRDLLAELRAALDVAGADPRERMRQAIGVHVGFGVRHRREVLVANAQLNDLPAARRREIVAMRQEYENVFRDILREGAASGAFQVDDERLVILLIMATGAQVARSAKTGDRLSTEDVSRVYAEFVLRGLRATE